MGRDHSGCPGVAEADLNLRPDHRQYAPIVDLRIVPVPETLQTAVASSLSRRGSAPLFLPIEAGGRAITYAEMDAHAARLAGAVVRTGVRPGDRVLVQIDKSPAAVALYLACLRIGAIYLPLNTDYTEAELAYFLGDAEPALAVCRPSSEGQFKRLISDTSTVLRTLDAEGGTLAQDIGEPAPAVPRTPDDTVVILYTSGTTGRPKGAMLSQHNLVANARMLVEHWRFTADDTLLHAVPLFHAHGLFVATHCSLLSGAKIILLPRFDADVVVANFPRASVFMGVPTHYTRLLSHPGFTREATAKMRLFLSGSAPLTEETFRAFETRIGKRILERYGMTETVMLTSNPYDGERLAGSVGRPLPGVSLRAVGRETGAEVAQGEVGSIEVKSESVFSGYWRNPAKTTEAFTADGFFRTGDMGYIDPKGNVHLVGRGGDLIISGGLNVYPKEIEAALDQISGITESAVIGVPHPDFGEAVVAVVTTASGARVDGEAVRAALRPVLAGFKIPKRVEVVDELPRNTIGKVQKTVLRARYAGLFTDPVQKA